MPDPSENAFPKRKHPRFKFYDYSRNGMYFVTICSRNKEKLFSTITDENPNLTEIGKIIEHHILAVPARFSGVSIDSYVIMPNHIHMIVYIHQRDVIICREDYTKKPTLTEIVGSFKSLTSRECWKKHGEKQIFQKSFFEHIIRSNQAYFHIKNYIKTNPTRWKLDCFFTE